MKHYLSFDVESVGLFGPPFCFGYVVVDETGKEHEAEIYGWDYRKEDLSTAAFTRSGLDARWSFSKEDREWVAVNVVNHLPDGWDNCDCVLDLLTSVYEDVWLRCQKEYENLVFVSDCPFPVEANFVETMLRVLDKRNMDHSPYPLLDVGSVLVGRGLDPLKEYERKPNELPAHNPVNDARQSVRIMLDAINGNFATKKEPGLFRQVFCPYCGHPLVLEEPPKQEEGPYNYKCTSSTCTWWYGGLRLHHALESQPLNKQEKPTPGFRRPPSIDFWSLSYIK